MSRRARKSPLLLLLACTLGGCARAREEPPAFGAREAHDAQVPASEPREELTVRVDLPARSDCEEAFDLLLYRDPGIELIAWEPRPGACNERSARVRYVATRTTRAALVRRIQELTTRMEITSP